MKKKILIVNNNLQIGGIQKSLINLLSEINDKYDITLFLFSKCGGYVDDIPKNVRVIESNLPLRVLGMSLADVQKKGLHYILIKSILVFITRIFGNGFAISLALLFQSKISGYDCVISYMHTAVPKVFYGGTNEFVLDKVNSNHKIAFIHCDFQGYGGDVDYSRRVYSRFNNIAFCSTGCMDSFTNAIPDFRKKSKVVYNCHNEPQILSLSEQDSVRYNDDNFNIILVSRLEYDKGIDIAIRAIKQYSDRFDCKVHLHIIGDGKDRNNFEKLVSALSMDSQVTFYGNQKNPYRYMKNSDLLILTSHHEAAPMVFGEAQILGVPILVTKTTSTTELILNRNAGLVCEQSIDSVVEGLKSIRDSVKFYPIAVSNELALAQFDSLVVAGM